MPVRGQALSSQEPSLALEESSDPGPEHQGPPTSRKQNPDTWWPQDRARHPILSPKKPEPSPPTSTISNHCNQRTRAAALGSPIWNPGQGSGLSASPIRKSLLGRQLNTTPCLHTANNCSPGKARCQCQGSGVGWGSLWLGKGIPRLQEGCTGLASLLVGMTAVWLLPAHAFADHSTREPPPCPRSTWFSRAVSQLTGTLSSSFRPCCLLLYPLDSPITGCGLCRGGSSLCCALQTAGTGHWPGRTDRGFCLRIRAKLWRGGRAPRGMGPTNLCTLLHTTGFPGMRGNRKVPFTGLQGMRHPQTTDPEAVAGAPCCL